MNLNNDNNNTGYYPLYLGGDLGLLDNVHECYPEVAEVRDELMRNRWDWREIDLSKDARDMSDPNLEMGRIAMIRNLSFQQAMDSLAATSIIQVMGNFCSNTEMLGLLQEWEGNEYVHGMAYSEITKKVMPDPNEMMEEIKNTAAIITRLEPIQSVFDATHKMSMLYALGLEDDIPRMRKQIIKYHAVLLGMEGVSFTGSFAATFGVNRAFKAYEGVKNHVQLIARDELDTHVDAGLLILGILRDEWPDEYAEILPEIQAFFNELYLSEVEWLDHLFEGIHVRGLNKTLLERYIRFIMGPICIALGLEMPSDFVEENPLPWMDDYINLGDIQVAAQETQIVNYNVNIIDDDVPDGPMDISLGDQPL